MISNRVVAKTIAHLDILLAAANLRAPLEPWTEVDEPISLAGNSSLNVPEPEPHEIPILGTSLPVLQRLCTSGLLVSLLERLQRIFAIRNALSRGTLRNFDPRALSVECFVLHHAILSIPPYYNDSSGSLYELVRLATLIFDVGIFFPLPPALGLLGRLVRWIRAELERMENTHDEKVEVLIWILFLAGAAAKGLPEKVWCVEILRALVDWHGLKRWSDVKQLLRSFVWEPNAMDEPAKDLWDDIRCYGDPGPN